MTGAEQRTVIPVMARLHHNTAGVRAGLPVTDPLRHWSDVVRAVHGPPEPARRRVRVHPTQDRDLLLSRDAVHHTLGVGAHRRVCEREGQVRRDQKGGEERGSGGKSWRLDGAKRDKGLVRLGQKGKGIV